jgi:hypothetical protein
MMFVICRKFIVAAAVLIFAMIMLYFLQNKAKHRVSENRLLYCIVDTNFEGNITIYTNCPKGKRLLFNEKIATVSITDTIVYLDFDISKVSVGIFDEGDLYDSKGVVKYLVDKNPRLLSVCRHADAAECKSFVTLKVKAKN